MNSRLTPGFCRFKGLYSIYSIAALAAVLSLRGADTPPAGAQPVVAKPAVNKPVTIAEDANSWTLDNGIVKIVVDKSSGRLISLYYDEGENLSRASEGWERYPSLAAASDARLRFSPSS